MWGRIKNVKNAFFTLFYKKTFVNVCYIYDCRVRVRISRLKVSGVRTCSPVVASIVKLLYFFFSGMPLMDCCHVSDMLPEYTIVGLPPGWVDTDVSQLYSSINPISQVLCGHPRGLLQSLGNRSDTLIARWRSCLESERATCPKKWSCLVLMILETGGQPVVFLTEPLVTCLVYGIQRIFRRDNVSKASSRRARVFVIVHVSDPYTNTGRTGLIQPDLVTLCFTGPCCSSQELTGELLLWQLVFFETDIG